MQIFRLEPRLTKNLSADTEPSEGLAQEGLAEGKLERKIADLTSLYGTKRDRDKVSSTFFPVNVSIACDGDSHVDF